MDYFPKNLGSSTEDQGEGLTEGNKEDATSTCSPITVGCLSERFRKVHIEEREQEELSQQKSNDYSDRNDC
jgi:hypothetical protein